MIERYKKSVVKRKKYLRDATDITAMTIFLGGQGHKNLQVYQDLYNDIMVHRYAWFEVIFKDRKELISGCDKFAKLKVDMTWAGLTISTKL